MVIDSPDSLLSFVVAPSPVPANFEIERGRLVKEITNLQDDLSKVTAETQRLAASASHDAIISSAEAMFQELNRTRLARTTGLNQPEEYRVLMQVAGLVLPVVEVSLEAREAANLAITRLLEDANFQSGYNREKNLAILDSRWIGSTNHEPDAYRFAIANNSEPIVAEFLLAQFVDASSYQKAGCLAQCLAGTKDPTVIAKVHSLIKESISVVGGNSTYANLSVQHLLAPMILKGTEDQLGIDLLVQALRLDTKSLTDRFQSVGVVRGHPAEQYLRFVARSLTPSMGSKVEDLILKTIVDPEIPPTVRRSLFVNCLIDPMKDLDKLSAALNFMRPNLSDFIQANYLRIYRAQDETFGAKVKCAWDVAVSLVRGTGVSKEYLNQVRTIANFLVGPTPSSGLNALEQRGFDYGLYNRALSVLAGNTGRQEFF